MALFEYKAIGADGKNSKGMVESDSVKNARQKLKKQGLMVTDIFEKSLAKKNANATTLNIFASRVKQEDIATATRQLASLIKANIPLVDALNALVDQLDNVGLKTVLSQVRESVNEGTSLSKSFAMHPKIFDNIYINMV